VAPQHFADCLREIRKLSARASSWKRWCRITAAAWSSRWISPPASRRMCSTTIWKPCRDCTSQSRPGSDFEWSLDLLEKFKQRVPGVPTKSGLMLGLGETDEEVIEVMHRMREHDIDMLTLGQYLQPSRNHLPVQRFVHPGYLRLVCRSRACQMGFKNIASGPLVRSSYHADQQAANK
jgi:lipoyl synthase